MIDTAIILLFALSTFLFFIAILQLVFQSNKRLEKRMKHYLATDGKLDRKKMNLAVQVQLYNRKAKEHLLSKRKNKKIEEMLARAGLPIKPEEYIIFQWMSTIILAALLFLFSGKIFFLLFGAVVGFMLPSWVVKKKQRERINKFNDALPDMISTIVGSLRAGFSFSQALLTVADESDDPVKTEIELTIKEMQYGSSMEEALLQLKERMPSDDLDLMIQAILIQRQVGGNLATILDTIVQTIRDRNKIHRQISTLTAQGRLSGIVIGLLPIGLAIVIYFLEPSYMSYLFTHPIGIGMLIAGLISGTIGFILIRKVTTIEV